MRVGASSSPSMTGLRHYRSGCVPIPCAGPPTTAATRPTTHARAGPTPHRRFHKLRRGLQSGGAEKQLVLSSSERLKPGQNSPCSTRPHPNRDKTLPAQRTHTQTGTKLSLHRQNGPNSTFLGEQGEFCHGNAPTSVRLANFVTDMPRSPRAWRILSRTCPEVPRPGTFCPAISCTLARSPTGSYVHRLLHRWAGTTHGASEAWLRCPRAVAGPGRASRSITPSRRLACGDLAGGPPPTGTHSSPAVATGSPRAHTAARRLHGHTQQPGRGHGQPTGTQSNPVAARERDEAATGFPATAS